VNMNAPSRQKKPAYRLNKLPMDFISIVIFKPPIAVEKNRSLSLKTTVNNGRIYLLSVLAMKIKEEFKNCKNKKIVLFYNKIIFICADVWGGKKMGCVKRGLIKDCAVLLVRRRCKSPG
ncbi:MAG TPA: hypothetical protein PKZ52_16850, partial [Cellvibrionaceae bacterium]|nr:hypothetical protein [Cellvibrionaceae bacterium]